MARAGFVSLEDWIVVFLAVVEEVVGEVSKHMFVSLTIFILNFFQTSFFSCFMLIENLIM